MEAISDKLLEHGLPGVIILVLIIACVALYKELRDERKARIADAERFRDVALALQEKAIVTANKLTDVFDKLEGRDRRKMG